MASRAVVSTPAVCRLGLDRLPVRSTTVQILSIQSSVAYGYVGNSAAVFPLQRLGHEVWPINTVHFSNHTGYGTWRGPLIGSADLTEVLTGVQERGALARVDAVLSGYLGDSAVADVVLDAVARVRAVNPAAIYCCDPVLGDVGRGFFVRPGLPELMRDRVLPQADLVTPNQFELEFLSGTQIRTRDDVLAAVDAVRALGPRTVLVTSVRHDATPDDVVSLVAVSDDGAWEVSTPLLPLAVNGAGDVTSALFLAHLVDAGARVALERTTASVFELLLLTQAAGTREIALVAAQDAIAHPPGATTATRLR
jgi:pyridoxine kinase